MASLALELVDSLLTAVQAGDVDKVILRGYFEKHSKNVDGKTLIPQVLEIVLTSLESNSSATDLHRDVVRNLIGVLRGEALITQNEAAPTAFPKETNGTSFAALPVRQTSEYIRAEFTSPPARNHEGVVQAIPAPPVLSQVKEPRTKPTLDIPTRQNGIGFSQHDPPTTTQALTIHSQRTSSGLSDKRDSYLPGTERAHTSPQSTGGTRTTQIEEVEKIRPKLIQRNSMKLLKSALESPYSNASNHSHGQGPSIRDEDTRVRSEKDTETEQHVPQSCVDDLDVVWSVDGLRMSENGVGDDDGLDIYIPDSPDHSAQCDTFQQRYEGHHGSGSEQGQNERAHDGNEGQYTERARAHTPTPRPRYEYQIDDTISIEGWGAKTPETPSPCRTSPQRREYSPTPSESASQVSPGWSSDLMENLRNHRPRRAPKHTR